MKFLRSALCVALLLVAAPLLLCAQQAGVLTGTVHDESGAIIPGAVVLVSGDGIPSKTATTNELGVYTVPDVPAGSYTVVITFPGFKESRSEYVNVTAGETTPIEITLSPKGAEDVVNVEASGAAQIETENSEQGGTISEKKLVTYGLNGRNFSQMIALAPGVSNQTGQDEAKVGVAGSAKYSVNGGRVEYNAFDVDGSDVLNTGINASKGKSMPLIVYPSLDAIEEVKVLTSNYGAQYGRSASGSVLVTTKSGGSDFHGNVYEFLRNEFFNSRNYFDQTAKAPLYRKNDFGGTFGGPLYIPGHYNKNKNKTFFFFSEEVRLEKSPDNGQFNQAVPSDAERGFNGPNGTFNGIANFSDLCPTIPSGSRNVTFKTSAYPDCPSLTGVTAVNGIPQGETLGNNQVGINPTAQTILTQTGLIPRAIPGAKCNSTTGSCYAGTVSPSTTWYEELFRIDHNLTPNEKLSFRFIHDSWTTTVLSPQWGAVQANSFPTVQNQFNGPGLSMVARLDQVLSPTFLNQLSLSYTDTHITLTDTPGAGVNLTRPSNSPLDPNCPTQTGGYTGCLGYLFNNGFGGKLPGINVAGNNVAYGGSGFVVDTAYMPWNHRNPTWDLRDGLNKVIGKHTLQTGVQVVYVRQSETNAATGANTGDVQGLLTFNNVDNWKSSGNAFTDFIGGPMAGQPYSEGRARYFQQDNTQHTYSLHYWVIEPYLQDDWRVTPRLTVNAGLRVSLFANWQMKQGQAWNWEPSQFSSALAAQTQIEPTNGELLYSATSNPVPLDSTNPYLTNGLVECGTHGTPSSCMSSHLFNPAPRIGFAWDPTGSGKTSIRAGYGLFFEHGTSSESNVGSLIGNAPLVLDVTQNLPDAYDAIGHLNPAYGPPGAWPINVTSIPTKAVWPYTQQWSLSVQQQVAKDTMISVAYVGSKGTHLTVEEQINQVAPVPAALNPFLPGQPITAALCQSYGGSTFNNGGTVAGPKVSSGDPAFVNLEAACVGATSGSPDVNTLRQKAPGLGSIYSLQNIASSNYHALQITIQHTQGPLNIGAAYTYGHSIDSASGRYSATFVNAYNLAANRASSDFDQRQMLNINYVWKLPLLDFYAGVWGALHCTKGNIETNVSCAEPGAISASDGPGKVMRTILSGWNLSGITTFQTGTPFSVINGASANGVSVLDNAGLALGLGADSYPDKVSGSGCNTVGSTINTVGPLLRSPCEFVAPRGLTQGNAGRNSMNNPGRANFDAAIFRQMKVLGERTLEFRAEAFNLFNHTQFRIFNPDKGNTDTNTVSCYGGSNNSAGASSCLAGIGFLHPIDARRPRTMQFGLKFGF